MKLFVIEIPKLINGEILALKGMIDRRTLEAFEQKYGLILRMEEGLSYTINFDGDSDYIFQGIRFDRLDKSPRISYFPLLSQDDFFSDVEKSIPDDITLVHKLRGQVGVYALRVSLLVSLLEFVEDFGANTVSLYDDLDSILAEQAEAEERYRMGEYHLTAELFTEIDELWELLDARALKAKENSLIWVYLIEWLTVSGASLATGAVLWMIMVNRRLYREVTTTKMA